MFPQILNVALAATEETATATTVAATSGSAWFGNNAFLAIAAALCIGLGALGASKAMGRIAKAALEGTARQPEVGGRLFTTMLIAMALVEALAIYCLLIAFMLLAKI
ncbi:MAG: ATP synthase F0 subunit C, partial [bacterium]